VFDSNDGKIYPHANDDEEGKKKMTTTTQG